LKKATTVSKKKPRDAILNSMADMTLPPVTA
jgi:hypothetical protein